MVDLSAGDKWNKFVEGIKPIIAFEVRKDNCMKLQDAARVALRVETGRNDSRRTAFEPMGNDPTPMELGSVETKWRPEKKKITDD